MSYINEWVYGGDCTKRYNPSDTVTLADGSRHPAINAPGTQQVASTPAPTGVNVNGYHVEMVGGYPTQIWDTTPYTAAQSAETAYAAAVATGCVIVSAGTPALSGTYSVDPVSLSHMADEVLSITADGTFIGGAITEVWPVTGGVVTLTVAEFTAIRKAVSGWVKGWAQYSMGLPGVAAPANPVNIP